MKLQKVSHIHIVELEKGICEFYQIPKMVSINYNNYLID